MIEADVTILGFDGGELVVPRFMPRSASACAPVFAR